MAALALIILIAVSPYVILIGCYTIRWRRFPEYIPGSKEAVSCFSVILPFRNEETLLPGILYDLSMQDYPPEKTEVILVNDHSLDDSAAIVQEYCNRYLHFRLVQLSDGKYGKKEAIDAGIQTASHDYIITTDADCRAGRQWLSVMASFCREFLPVMVIGLVVPEASGSGFFSYFQQLESISLAGAGAASAIGGKPIYCSGANLCYRREIYSGTHDPMRMDVVSGDDTFLLLQMKIHCRKDIRVLKSKQALISTKTEERLSDFFRQRSRWISKSRHYRDREILYPAFVVMLANLAILAAAVLCITGYQPWLLPVALMAKLLTDGFLISSLSAYGGIKFKPVAYIASGIIYPFYLVITAARALLFPVEWKGRKGNEP